MQIHKILITDISNAVLLSKLLIEQTSACFSLEYLPTALLFTFTDDPEPDALVDLLFGSGITEDVGLVSDYGLRRRLSEL
jgi:hypothetical protein